MKKVLIISAHPDDETLGAGGTLLKHKSNGDKIYWVIITKPYEKDGFTKDFCNERKKEILKVSSFYQFSDVFELDFPARKLDSSNLPNMIELLSSIFQKIKPEIIYSLNRSDAHSDHRLVFNATMACIKSFRYPFIKKVLMYECLSETEFSPSLSENVFIPNYFVDITNFMDKKLKIMQCFKNQMSDAPFPRSIENISALATHRGCTCGVKYAESFYLIKYIDK